VTLDPVVYTVKHDSRWKSLADVAAAAKANPKGFRYGLGQEEKRSYRMTTLLTTTSGYGACWQTDNREGALC
jgi:tripartite-type tricarboxylate transporter receptor subunit TctC